MTHKLYAFLFNKEREFTLKYEAEDMRFDFNNWHQEMCTVDRQGNVDLLCPNDDWRGRQWLYEYLHSLPADQRWDKALEYADNIFRDEIAWLLDDESNLAGVPYERLETILRDKLAVEAGTMPAHKIKQIAHAISSLNYRHECFSEVFGNPYVSVRTYIVPDQFDGNPLENENAAILFADIHT